MQLLAVGLSLLLTLLAVIIGLAKVQRLPASLQIRDRSGIAPGLWTASGWIELVAAGFLVVGVFAALGVAAVAAGVLSLSYAAFALRQLTRRLAIAVVSPAIVLVALSLGTAAAIVSAG
ncbi:MAG: hypothetical protein LH645_10385 [Actinomycetia bacterium]|nr:hypothetical protein [Actinomycetes bacterium]